MQGFRKDYGLSFVMLSGLLVVVMVCILLFFFYIINEAGKCKRRQFI